MKPAIDPHQRRIDGIERRMETVDRLSRRVMDGIWRQHYELRLIRQSLAVIQRERKKKKVKS